MPTDLTAFYQDLRDHNWFAVAAIVIMCLIQVAKKFELPLWTKTPLGYRFLWPILLGAAVAFVHGYLTHETAGASIWDAVKVAFTAMGGAAALKESPLPWSGGAGGILQTVTAPPTEMPAIPPLHLVTEDDRPTPVDFSPRPPSDPPPDNAA